MPEIWMVCNEPGDNGEKCCGDSFTIIVSNPGTLFFKCTKCGYKHTESEFMKGRKTWTKVNSVDPGKKQETTI